MKKLILFFLVAFAFSVMSCKSDSKQTESTTTEVSTTGETNQEPEGPKVTEPEIVAPVTPNTGDFTLTGVLGDATAKQQVEMLQIPYNNSKPKSLVKSVTTGDGNFKFKFKHPGKGVYSLKLGQNQVLFLLDGSEKEVAINVAKGGFRTLDLDVKGADDNKRYFAAMKGIGNGTVTSQALVKMITEEKNPLLASLIALQVLTDPSFADLHSAVHAKLAKDPQVNKDLYTNPYGQYIAGMTAQAQGSATGIKVGAMAPDLAYKNPDGKIMKLSDLRGKLVLLDFWASWCRPCRKANPEVVKIYKKYKDQGFTVFSVSLDGDRRGSTDPKVIKRNHDKWVDAIKQDGLIWPNHVSDLKSWNSEASAKYGVTSIPATFLIGRDGKVVAINPRYNLEEMVKKNL